MATVQEGANEIKQLNLHKLQLHNS